MGRKRITLTASEDAEVFGRIQRGESAETISAALHGRVSPSWVRARRRDVRSGGVQVTSRPLQPAPVGGEDPPEADLETVPNVDAIDAQRWMEKIETAASKASAEGNFAALGTLGRLKATFMTLKLKHAPIKPPDPNENPDMKAAAARARARLHDYIEKALAG